MDIFDVIINLVNKSKNYNLGRTSKKSTTVSKPKREEDKLRINVTNNKDGKPVRTTYLISYEVINEVQLKSDEDLLKEMMNK